MSDPPTLVVDGVQVADEAVYICRVDYKVRPSAITKVNLTVIGKEVNLVINVYCMPPPQLLLTTLYFSLSQFCSKVL